jgi:hypothetical protein
MNLSANVSAPIRPFWSIPFIWRTFLNPQAATVPILFVWRTNRAVGSAPMAHRFIG